MVHSYCRGLSAAVCRTSTRGLKISMQDGDRLHQLRVWSQARETRSKFVTRCMLCVSFHRTCTLGHLGVTEHGGPSVIEPKLTALMLEPARGGRAHRSTPLAKAAGRPDAPPNGPTWYNGGHLEKRLRGPQGCLPSV
jgi:hypothetical protein